MSNPPPPQFLQPFIEEQSSATYAVRLIWENAVNYDRIIVRWDPVTTLNSPIPGSADLDGDVETYTVQGFLPGSSWVLKVEGGTEDLLGGWSYSGFVETTVTFLAYSQLLLYRQATGDVFTAPILGGASVGVARYIGPWRTDWTQLVPFGFEGGRFLLLYRQADGSVWTSGLFDIGDGSGLSNVAEPAPALDLEHNPVVWQTPWMHVMAFAPIFGAIPFLIVCSPPDNSVQGGGRHFFQTAPILSPSQIGNLSDIRVGEGVQDQNWAQIVPFVSDGDPYLLFYNQSTGNTYTAPVMFGPQIGDLTQIGTWETDWALITAFVSEGSSFLLVYKRNGAAWTAPIETGTHVGSPTLIGGWENDWALLLPFNGRPGWIL